jgi:nucleotidyltransferase/DNA polymerase involved in DNA repair
MILSLWTPHLPVQAALAEQPALINQPLIIVGQPWDDERVLASSSQAQAVGVKPGQRLSAAQSHCPEATVLPADTETYHALHQALRDTLYPHTERVETVDLGGLLADLQHLNRDRESGAPKSTWVRLARRISREAQDATGLDVRVGLGPQRFTAEQAAQAATTRGWAVVLPAEARGFLASLPLESLPAEQEIQRRLHLLGIHTLGGLARLPRQAVIRQFGAQAGFLHDLASGNDARPVQPDAPPLRLTRSHAWEHPVLQHGPVAAQISRLLQALAVQVQRTGYQVQGLRVTVATAEGHVLTQAGSVEPPTADEARLIRRALLILEKIQPAAEIVSLSLTLYPLRPAYLGATQLALFTAPQSARRRRLQETFRRLRQRFGEFIIQVAALVAPPPPQPIQVVKNADGKVQALVWPDHLAGVVRLYEHWRVRRRWWGRPIRRNYYRLETAEPRVRANHGVRVVFHDLETDRWWLERRAR